MAHAARALLNWSPSPDGTPMLRVHNHRSFIGHRRPRGSGRDRRRWPGRMVGPHACASMTLRLARTSDVADRRARPSWRADCDRRRGVPDRHVESAPGHSVGAVRSCGGVGPDGLAGSGTDRSATIVGSARDRCRGRSKTTGLVTVGVGGRSLAAGVVTRAGHLASADRQRRVCWSGPAIGAYGPSTTLAGVGSRPVDP